MRLNRIQAPQVRVGCSGWQYRHWRGDFYPAGLPVSRWFEHYARIFDTVEINNSFYRLPPPETFDKWRTQAPDGFLYAVKASRFLTHMKKLKDPEAPLQRLFDAASQLRQRLGPVLYQLPPNWPVHVERLETFLRTLPRGVRHVLEFRDASWYDDRVFALLERHGVALCLHDMQGSATGQLAVGPFVYVRYHFGTARYGGRYDDRRLDLWADWLNARLAAGHDVFAYFNNDTGGHAPRDAVRLRDRLRHAQYNRRVHGDPEPSGARAGDR
jgi:uncharacterized protein YecE (DUF72 family)